MLDVELNDAKLNKAPTTDLIHDQRGKHDMNTYTYGGVAVLPGIFFLLGMMLIMSVMH